MARPEELNFASTIRTTVGKIDNPAGRPQIRVVVAPKGPYDVFSPWEAPDRAIRRDVYAGLVTKGLLCLGGILGGGKRHAIPGKYCPKSSVWHVRGADTHAMWGQECMSKAQTIHQIVLKRFVLLTPPSRRV